MTTLAQANAQQRVSAALTPAGRPSWRTARINRSKPVTLLAGPLCDDRVRREHCWHDSCQPAAAERSRWRTAQIRPRRNHDKSLAGPVCYDRDLRNNCAHDSCSGVMFNHVPMTALRAEIKARRAASPSRDVLANKENANGVYKDNDEMRAFAVRAILAYAARVGAGDIDGLPGLEAMHDVVEDAMGVACRALVKPVKAEPGNGKPATPGRDAYSWANVGKQLGVARQTAHDNYSKPGVRRKRGTQLAGTNGKAA
jgi:hypothetical protein